MLTSTDIVDIDHIQNVELFGGAIKIQLPKNIIDVSTFRQVPDNQEVFIIKEKKNEKEDEILKSKKNEIKYTKIKDLSIIIEVLELVNLNENEEYQQQQQQQEKKNYVENEEEFGKLKKDYNNPTSIIKYHFNSLAYDNSSNLTEIKSIETPNNKEEFYKKPELININTNISSSTSKLITRRKTPSPIKLYGIQSISKFNSSNSNSHNVHIWLSLWRLIGIGNNEIGTDLILTFNLPQFNSISNNNNNNKNDEEEFKKSFNLVNSFFHSASNSLEIIDWSLFA